MSQDAEKKTERLPPEMKAILAIFQDQLARTSSDIRADVMRLEASLNKAGVATFAEESPDQAVTFNDLGVQLFYRNELPEARAALEKATASNPQLLEAWNNLAMVYSALGENERAEEAFSRAIALDPDRVEVLNNHAVLHLLRRSDEEALAILERSEKHNPRHIPTLLNLAQACYRRGEHERAVRAWKMVTVIDPGNEEARQNLRQYFQ